MQKSYGVNVADGDYEFSLPSEWYSNEQNMYLDLVGGIDELRDDATLQSLFHEAMFDRELSQEERDTVYEELLDYLYDEYGIDFEDSFDWDAYREWYG